MASTVEQSIQEATLGESESAAAPSSHSHAGNKYVRHGNDGNPHPWNRKIHDWHYRPGTAAAWKQWYDQRHGGSDGNDWNQWYNQRHGGSDGN